MAITNMFDKNYYTEYDYSMTSPFAENRSKMYIDYCPNGDGKHEGIDYSHNKKHFDIYNLFNGVIYFRGDNKEYGQSVMIYTNPFYICKDINDTFITQYCHLNSINDNVKKNTFVLKGTKLGIMGNTGFSQGTHLHLMCYQDRVKKNEYTKLLNHILLTLNTELIDDIAFWQFGRLFFNPLSIMEYFNKMQGGA